MSEDLTLDEFQDKSGNDHKQRQEWREVKLGGVSWKRSENVDPQEVDLDRHVGLEHIEPNTPSPNWEPLDDLSSTKRRFYSRDILFAKLRPNLEKSAQPDFEGVCSTDIFPIVADQGVNSKWLLYRLSSKPAFDYARRTSAGTRMPRTSWNLFSNFDFDLPPLPEQRKISTVLYTVDRAIEKKEKVIDQIRRIKQGVMEDLFEGGYNEHDNYGEVRIGPFTYEKPESWEVCSIEESKGSENGLRRGPFGGMLKKEIFVDSGYKVYQQQNVIYCDFDYGDYYITEEKFRDMERFSVSAGDILISCSGTLGKVAVVPEEYEEGVINQALLKFAVDNEMFQTQYMKYFLESKIGQRQLVLSSRGSAMKNMAPMEFVRSAQIFKPPIDEQEEISGALFSFDERINAEKKKKKHLMKLKSGLIQDLLSGKVRTTDTNIEVPDKIAQHG